MVGKEIYALQTPYSTVLILLTLSPHGYSAFLVCDRIGRIWAVRQLCAIWILGIGLFLGANGNLGMIYAGRFIAGLGVGVST